MMRQALLSALQISQRQLNRVERVDFWLRLFTLGLMSRTDQVNAAKLQCRACESELLRYDTLIAEGRALAADDQPVSLEGVRISKDGNADIPLIGGATYGPDWELIREQILQRDSHTCQEASPYCSGPLHVHHRIPLGRRGGTNQSSNLVTLCEYHHSLKHPHMRRSSRGSLWG